MYGTLVDLFLEEIAYIIYGVPYEGLCNYGPAVSAGFPFFVGLIATAISLAIYILPIFFVLKFFIKIARYL